MTAKTLRTWYLVHKWTSLISTIFLLMLCLTGLPLIFHERSSTTSSRIRSSSRSLPSRRASTTTT